MPDDIMPHIVNALQQERTLEGTVRNFLKLIEITTGLESAYLTHIDLSQNVQTILFSRNTSSLTIPEGLSVTWGDTLCKRALDESCPYTDDVAGRWGDSDAARVLGIQTYASTPVHVEHALYGTLCGASARRKAVTSRSRDLLVVFGQIISMHLEREALLTRLESSNRQLEEVARIDPLTGLFNRRHLVQEMEQVWSAARREGRSVLVAFIDLDGFKGINDRYGHDIGDELLIAVGGRLLEAMRIQDLVARIGGDEFVVVATVPPGCDASVEAQEKLRRRLEACMGGVFCLSSVTLDYAGSSVGIVDVPVADVSPEQALKRADEAMYAVKRLRRDATQ